MFTWFAVGQFSLYLKKEQYPPTPLMISAKKPYLHNLTALRGIAAVLVVVLHFDFFVGKLITGPAAEVSGFVICYVYEQDFARGIDRKKYGRFIWARLARIYPLHVFALLAEVGLYLTYIINHKNHLLPAYQQYMYKWEAIPVQLTFLQTVGIYNMDTWNAPSWSLSAEWWAYLLFPFLLIWVINSRSQLPKLITGIAVVAGWLFIEYYLAAREPFMQFPPNAKKIALDVNWHYGTLRGIIGFTAGMLSWQLYRKNMLRALLANGWAFGLLSLLILFTMHFKGVDTLAVCLMAALILSAAYGAKGTDAVLQLKPLQALGRWSFSIYIWHMVLINILLAYFTFPRAEQVKGLLQPLNGDLVTARLSFLVFLAVTCLVGFLSYRYLEKPSREWLRNKFQ